MAVDKQMELFEPVVGAFDEGGLMDEGGSVDPESGNDVPVGSTQEEVRDDIPAQLSEGEFVLPADVVRFHGLEKIMSLRDEAKAGLARMEAMGQMGNSEEATIPDGIPFSMDDLEMEDDGVQDFAQGGVVQAQAGTFVSPNLGTYQQPSQVGGYQPQYTPYTPPPMPSGQTMAQQYTPAQQQAVPTITQQAPTFTGFTGSAAPSPGGYDEMKTYVNDSGMEMQIPFKDGKPIYPIPEGYKVKGEAVQTAQTTTTTDTGIETTRDTRDTGDGVPAPEFSTTDVSGIGYNRSKIENKDLLDAINKSTGALAKGIGASLSLGTQVGQKFGVVGGIKAENAILGGVIDQFRGGDVSFESGRKVGNYGITTELHNLNDLQQQQIADVFKSVSEKMDGLYTKTNEEGEKVSKTQAEVTSSLRIAAERLGISTTFGKSNVTKRNDTIAREIAKAEADKETREKSATREKQAITAAADRAAEALPSGYKIDTSKYDNLPPAERAREIRKEVSQQQTRQKEDQARAEREAAQAKAEAARGGGDDSGGIQTSQRGQDLATSGGYSVGDSTFGALAKGGLVEQMEKSGLTPKK